MLIVFVYKKKYTGAYCVNLIDVITSGFPVLEWQCPIYNGIHETFVLLRIKDISSILIKIDFFQLLTCDAIEIMEENC